MTYADFKQLCETHGWVLATSTVVGHGNATRYLYCDNMGNYVAELFHDCTSLYASYLRMGMNTLDVAEGMKK